MVRAHGLPYRQRRAVFGGSRGPIDLAVGTEGGSRGPAHPRPAQAEVEQKKKRTFRKFTYRGVDLDQLLDMS